jgi:hypothetical protein
MALEHTHRTIESFIAGNGKAVMEMELTDEDALRIARMISEAETKTRGVHSYKSGITLFSDGTSEVVVSDKAHPAIRACLLAEGEREVKKMRMVERMRRKVAMKK